jgi:hypothetical protein
MTKEQKIILDAAEMLIAANNKFAEYYAAIFPTIPVLPPNGQFMVPAERVVVSFLEVREDLLALGKEINLDLEPTFKQFIECETH